MDSLRIALAQTSSVDGDINTNIKNAIRLIESASKQKVNLIVFPEKYLTGYIPDEIKSHKQLSFSEQDERLMPLYDACNKNDMVAIIGAATSQDDKLFVSSIVISSEGKEVIRYHKMNLFQTEKDIYTPGSNYVILDLKGWKLGLGICYDAGFPEHSRILAKHGAFAYVVSSLFSKGNGLNEVKTWFPARALDNTIFVSMTNYVGRTGVWETCGNNGIWNPMGQPIKIASEDIPELMVCDLNYEDMVKSRLSERMLVDSDLYTISSNEVINIKVK